MIAGISKSPDHYELTRPNEPSLLLSWDGTNWSRTLYVHTTDEKDLQPTQQPMRRDRKKKKGKKKQEQPADHEQWRKLLLDPEDRSKALHHMAWLIAEEAETIKSLKEEKERLLDAKGRVIEDRGKVYDMLEACRIKKDEAESMGKFFVAVSIIEFLGLCGMGAWMLWG